MTEKQIGNIQDIVSLYDLAIYNCLHFGTYTMLIYEGQEGVREHSNVQIAQEATALAAGLQALGIQKGDRVLVMMLNCPEVIISYQAIARAGAVIIPVLPVLKGPELHYIAENSAAKAVITNSLLLPLVQGALANVSAMQHIISTGTKGSQATASTGDKHNESHLQTHAYEDILTKGVAHADLYLSDLEGVSPAADDTVVTIYTSGTTGRPKGVMLTHRNLVANAISGWKSDTITTRIGEKQLAILPLAHSYGLLIANVAYLSGATIVMHSRFEPMAVLSAIERYRISSFAAVPAMFVALFNTPGAEKYDTSSLQYCVSGSAPLPVAVLEGFEKKFGCRILEGYGLTEGSTALTAHRLDMVQKPGSVGKALSNVELLIADENDQPVATGEMGEILARGPNIMKGYYDMPEETQATLRNGWLHTGDIGRFDEDGYLYIVERKKDLIIRGGLNIYPRDVEEVLNSHPAVIESAVIGAPSERMGEEVKAFVVTRSPIDEEALKTYCREMLANYKTPSEIEFVNALPRNTVGKIDKKVLRRLI